MIQYEFEAIILGFSSLVSLIQYRQPFSFPGLPEKEKLYH